MSKCSQTSRAALLITRALGPDDAADYAHHAAGCADCQQALATAAIGDAVLELHIPGLFQETPGDMAPSTSERTNDQPPPALAEPTTERPANNVRAFVAGVVLAASAALVLVMVRPPPGDPPTEPDPRRLVELGGGTESGAAPPPLRIAVMRGETVAPLPAGDLPASTRVVLSSEAGAAIYLRDEAGFVPLVPRGEAWVAARGLTGPAVVAAAVGASAQPFNASTLEIGDRDSLSEGQAITITDLSVAAP